MQPYAHLFSATIVECFLHKNFITAVIRALGAAEHRSRAGVVSQRTVIRDSLLTVDALLNPERALDARPRLRAPAPATSPDFFAVLGRRWRRMTSADTTRWSRSPNVVTAMRRSESRVHNASFFSEITCSMVCSFLKDCACVRGVCLLFTIETKFRRR